MGEKGLRGEGILHGGDGTSALPGPLNEGGSLVGFADKVSGSLQRADAQDVGRSFRHKSSQAA